MARGKRKQRETYAYEPDCAVAPGQTLQETIDALECQWSSDFSHFGLVG
jgi:hypothetical protein